jgi:hypothetical protein
VCRCDTLFMKMRLGLALFLVASVAAQTTEEDFHVYKEHPRLILTAARLKLLRRERERQTPRWQQFDALIQGKAAMPEPAFAYALYHQVTGNPDAAKTAAAAAKDARSLALAYDWLPDQRQQLEPKLRAASSALPSTVDGMRTRALIAIVLEDNATLERIVKDWWRKQIAPALNSGQRVFSHAEVYPLMELMHVIRDNINIDLREDARAYFKDFAASRILSYYPPTFPAPENDFHIPYGPPDLKVAAMTRVAELSLVAYDNNSTDTQFVQGWLMHDRFALRGPLGAPYEFLWANPYQPGLSYAHLPLQYHDARAGRLFVRSSWEEDATWLGYVNGKAEMLREGNPQPMQVNKTFIVGQSVITPAKSPLKLDVKADEPKHWFVVGWKPFAVVEVEADDEELDEKAADRGGILPLEFKREQNMSVRLHLRPAQPAVAAAK